MEVQGVVTLVLVVAAIIAGLRIGLGLGLSIMLTALGLGLFTNSIAEALRLAVLDEGAWILVLSALTIASLAELYRVTNAIEELGRGLSASLGDPRVGLAAIPAVVGLMPIAGGALLSAPLVGSLGAPLGLTAEALVYVNVWFRHTLLYSYPFSQLAIVMSQLTGIPVLTLMLPTLPITALMVLLGAPVLLRARRARLSTLSQELKGDLKALVPLGIAVALLVPLVPLVGNWAVPLGSSLAILSLAVLKRALRLLPKAVLSKRVGDMVLAVVAVVVLREVISLSGLAAELGDVVYGLGGAKLALALVSTLVSVATGSVVTGLFVSLPLLSSLGMNSTGAVLLVYTYSFLGYVASPTHLCLLYTVEYFKADLISTYKYILPPTLVVLLLGSVYYLALG